MKTSTGKHRAFLLRLASNAMRERGFEPEFSRAALASLEHISGEVQALELDVQDLRKLLWCSIDNDDSRDLDQLTVAEEVEGGRAKILVAIADVARSVSLGSPIDQHARLNTTSVYTPVRVFPMLPERLSTDLTSLNPGVDRVAFVVEAVISPGGDVEKTSVYRAIVHNQAKLAYSSVGSWLEGKGPMPERLTTVPGLDANLRTQDRAAQLIKGYRREHGALDFAPLAVKALLKDDSVHSLQPEEKNRAHELIENFMIAANGVIAEFLTSHRFPVVRRVVRSPERWRRIMDVAEHLGTKLPGAPDAKALQEFLTLRRRADPLRFADLSTTIIKLLGRGEYIATSPDQATTGHFGLAVQQYTHSTAPNRRYPDLITQRLIRAALAGKKVPYGGKELSEIAEHCTQKEDDARHVERRLGKSAAALLLEHRWGESFDGLVTGASAKGTWVRIFEPLTEGRVERGGHDLDVGDKVRVKLIRTDPELGYIDFECVRHGLVGRRRRR